MCFSATASFTASAVLTGLGVMSLRVAVRPEEKPLAAIPLLFGIQQGVEGALWLLLPDQPHTVLVHVLIQLYALLAGAVWPVLVPVSLWRLEAFPGRRLILGCLAGLGAAIALYTLAVALLAGFTAAIANQCVVYGNPAGGWPGILPIYVTAACVPFFVSSLGGMRWIGAANAIGLVAAAAFYSYSLPSVWCYFAALTSVLIYVWLRKVRVERPAIS